MIESNKIGWGSYKSFSGPYYYGKPDDGLLLPEKHGMLDEAVYVTAKTEGTATSINMYD